MCTLVRNVLAVRVTSLPPDIENDLVQHILLLEYRFYGLARQSLLRLAYQMAKANNITTHFNPDKEKAGKEWLCGFSTRHPEVSLRVPQASLLARAAGFNRQRVGEIFKLLQKIAQNEDLTPDRIFNMDETGFTSVWRPKKVLTHKGKHKVGATTFSEHGRIIMFVFCVSTSGMNVPPLTIYPRKNLKAELTEWALPGSIFAGQGNGWINADLFIVWLNHFNAAINPCINRKVLLILDGHVSHILNIAAIIRAQDNGVVMHSLPPR
jgi:hypothetical protein